ncbi:hypothetical protein AGMMS49949_06720 [Alphaproteobacteria bacterium]|nr:hypothetical protein AGMMS49949_06720 [Alphaproteobacteria bacterium]GHS98486.1 hypothetical protein AGMMS50296_6190 [Alphaproteobacteria bacterium]
MEGSSDLVAKTPLTGPIRALQEASKLETIHSLLAGLPEDSMPEIAHALSENQELVKKILALSQENPEQKKVGEGCLDILRKIGAFLPGGVPLYVRLGADTMIWAAKGISSLVKESQGRLQEAKEGRWHNINGDNLVHRAIQGGQYHRFVWCLLNGGKILFSQENKQKMTPYALALHQIHIFESTRKQLTDRTGSSVGRKASATTKKKQRISFKERRISKKITKLTKMIKLLEESGNALPPELFRFTAASVTCSSSSPSSPKPTESQLLKVPQASKTSGSSLEETLSRETDSNGDSEDSNDSDDSQGDEAEDEEESEDSDKPV